MLLSASSYLLVSWFHPLQTMASASTLSPSSGIEVLEAHARALGTLTDATPRVGYAPARKSGAQVHEMPHTHRGSKSPGRGQLQSTGGETLHAAAMAAAAAAVLGGSGSNLITAAGGHADMQSTAHLNVGELQRVDVPRELHAPARLPMPSAPLSFVQQASSSPSKAPPPKKPSKVGHILSKIKDYEVRAAACLRAGRSRCPPDSHVHHRQPLMTMCREQGDAVFCMALLHDNLDNREQANALYIKYLRLPHCLTTFYFSRHLFEPLMPPLLQILQHLRADESCQRAGASAEQPRH